MSVSRLRSGALSVALFWVRGASGVQFVRMSACLPAQVSTAAAGWRRSHARMLSVGTSTAQPPREVGASPPAEPPASMHYAVLAEVLAKLDEESSRLLIISELAALLRRIMADSPRDLVPTLQLATAQLGPSAEGIELGMGEIGMHTAIAEAASVSVAQVRALSEVVGDLGLVARDLPMPSTDGARPLSVREVLATALEIAQTGGDGAVERKAGIAARLLRNASPLERLYLVRTLLGRLRVGASEATVLSALGRARLALELALGADEAPDAAGARRAEALVRTAFARLPNLPRFCDALMAGSLDGLVARTRPQHGVPVQPMLPTAISSLDEARARLKGGAASFEYKYDGERVQVHARRPSPLGPVEMAVFSRSCENVTFKYATLRDDASAWLAEGTREAIFEAEAVAYDRVAERILPFADIARRPRKAPKAKPARSSRAGAASKEDEPTPAVAEVCLFAFDLLSVDGASALDAPFAERRRLLRAALVPARGRLQFATSLDSAAAAAAGGAEAGSEAAAAAAGDGQTIEAFMRGALSAGCEGLVVKSLDAAASAYEPGHRSVRSFKLKRDYLAGQVDSFDLVPVGAYWGKGKRAGRYGAFLLACRAEEAGGEALQTVCKLGSGFSDADVDGLAAWFAANGLVRDSPAPELDLGAMAKGRQPDVWLEPAAVWEVLAAEISESPTYSAARAPGGRGLALRFPRFVRARDDKRVRDASVGAQIMSAYAAQLALSPGTPGPPELALSPVD